MRLPFFVKYLQNCLEVAGFLSEILHLLFHFHIADKIDQGISTLAPQV